MKRKCPQSKTQYSEWCKNKGITPVIPKHDPRNFGPGGKVISGAQFLKVHKGEASREVLKYTYYSLKTKMGGKLTAKQNAWMIANHGKYTPLKGVSIVQKTANTPVKKGRWVGDRRKVTTRTDSTKYTPGSSEIPSRNSSSYGTLSDKLPSVDDASSYGSLSKPPSPKWGDSMMDAAMAGGDESTWLSNLSNKSLRRRRLKEKDPAKLAELKRIIDERKSVVSSIPDVESRLSNMASSSLGARLHGVSDRSYKAKLRAEIKRRKDVSAAKAAKGAKGKAAKKPKLVQGSEYEDSWILDEKRDAVFQLEDELFDLIEELEDAGFSIKDGQILVDTGKMTPVRKKMVNRAMAMQDEIATAQEELFDQLLSDRFDEKSALAWKSRKNKATIQKMRDDAIKSERPLGGGVNETIKVKNGYTGVFKPITGEVECDRMGMSGGTYFTREAAAYRLDDYMGWNNVPPTTVIKYKGEIGSVQEFMPGYRNVHKFKGSKREIMLAEMADHKTAGVYDFLIANADRHGGNAMWSPTKGFTLIDNGLAFPNRSTQLLRDECFIRSMFVQVQQGKKIDGAVLKQLKAIDNDDLRKTMQGVLSDKDIDGILDRKDYLLSTGRIPRDKEMMFNGQRVALVTLSL